VINPDALRSQIEGNIVQTLSRTLFEEVAFDTARVTSVDWATYPILTFPDVPEILIDIVDRPKEPPLGAGGTRQCDLRCDRRAPAHRAFHPAAGQGGAGERAGLIAQPVSVMLWPGLALLSMPSRP
jgi:hypothetical protein